ncbi:MAG: VIT and VWA domain-containing protein [Fimbriiglobus sp.]|nr:VIT and VWA domain-containing protein [Fimbriiglobus sp.]
MRRSLVLLVLAAVAPAGFARGLLVPDDVKVPPLAMVHHKVTVAIEDQVAVTTVEQAFRNHTDRDLEATYLFPVPRGASVNKFAMWIDGKETAGELLDSKKASDVYTSIVRRTQDPALLEYLGNGLMRLRVFPVPPTTGGKYGDVKVKLSYTSVAPKDGDAVEFVYPLKTDGKAARTLEEFSVRLSIKSSTPIQSVYSPTHAIDVKRVTDKHTEVEFARNQATLDKDFQLFYGTGTAEIGVTPVLYRPVSGEDGFFLLLVSPQVESLKTKRTPRDLVLVLDTSGSMSDVKMSQVKQAVRKCLNSLDPKDRFALIAFSTGVNPYSDKLEEASPDQIEKATNWIDQLRAGGGTAIQAALDAALDLRGKDPSRSFTVTFFTDGQPTVGETNPQRIVKAVGDKNTTNTRIFTFGVGDDVNAAMLDQLADATRAVSTYVRPAEDIEAKATALYAKISHPVMTDVKLTGSNVKLSELYAPQLPDLFHGSQLVVFGRYSGSGHAAVKLSGKLAGEDKEFVYEIDFPAKTDNGREFVESLWARRKVGFLLDQIRVNGEQKELVEEVTKLAKKYGIATPYTSYLVVPDAVMPVAQGDRRNWGKEGGFPAGPGVPPPGLAGPGGFGGGGGVPAKVDDYAKKLAEAKKDAKPGEGLASGRGEVQDKVLQTELEKMKPEDRARGLADALQNAQRFGKDLKEADQNYKGGKLGDNQRGRLGVELATASNNLRTQERLSLTANRQVQGRNCVEIGGVWIDDAFDAKTKTLTVKAQSDAYFALLAKHPELKKVFLLGNHTVWIAPSGTALVIDANSGQEKLDEKEILALFKKS